MHLLRMELENFKSFSGEVTIPLEEGFTAITGPNGSGKSNTLDALEFVLGPKSTKSLRAANVTQLIFNGGKRGRPANMGESVGIPTPRNAMLHALVRGIHISSSFE